MDVVGVGQISLDRVAALPRWPRAGEKVALAAPPAPRPGGQIATALLAAVRLGLAGRLIGAVGDDAEAELALAPLRAAGVDASRVWRVAGAATRSALVLVAPDGERTVLESRDPGLALRPTALSREAIALARVLLVDAEDPDASRWAIEVARGAGTASVLDVERADPDRIALASAADFPIVSESFTSGSEESDRLAQLAAGRARMAVVTHGARGARARCGDETIEQPAFTVPVVDTTGAGDAFRGAFAWAVVRGASARRALALAAAAGALACRGQGAQGSLPTAAEVEALAR